MLLSWAKFGKICVRKAQKVLPMAEPSPVVLSRYQAAEMLAALRARAESVTSSIDLNLTRRAFTVTSDGVLLDEGNALGDPLLDYVARDENSCWIVEGDELVKIEAFSEETQRYYSLYPTPSAPTMLISGIPMHRIQGTDPWRDTQAKIAAAGPIHGDVLDTCTGLGYTALQAAKSASHVTTVELDETAHEVVRQNPWSGHIFTEANVTMRIGDSAEVVAELPNASFDIIIHDPPMFSLAGDLYSADFYREAKRILRKRGRFFHYIGNPESKSGATVTRGVIRRLQEVGYARVIAKPQAFGVTAFL